MTAEVPTAVKIDLKGEHRRDVSRRPHPPEHLRVMRQTPLRKKVAQFSEKHQYKLIYHIMISPNIKKKV